MSKQPPKAGGNDEGSAADSANVVGAAQSIESLQLSEALGNTFNLRRFGGDVLVYAIGQGLLLLLGFIQTLIIPKYLSMEGYGNWQLFMLYGSYVGVLHLGFIDGILVRWAGKELSQVGSGIRTAFRFLLFEQVIIVAPLSLLLYFLLQPPFQWLGLMLLAYAFILNLVTFFTFTTQAIRRFKSLTVMNTSRGAVFLLFVGLLFAFGYLHYNHVVFAFIAAYLLVLLVFIFLFRKYLGGKMPSITSLKACGKQNIAIGIFVLLGNFVVALFMTIDRLVVSSFFSIEQFAVYAFALMITMVAYTFIGAVSQVFFPYLSASATELRTRVYRLGKSAIILSWAVILAAYFPLTKLIEFYLPNFVASLPLLQILSCTVGFGGLIRILHVNYYKAYRKQRQYFLWGIMALALSAVLNLLAIQVWGTLESVAIATLISFGVWYIVNELSLKSVVGESDKDMGKGMLIICCYLAAFWLASLLVDWFIFQMLIYICFFSLITCVFFRSEVKELKTVVNIFSRKKD